MNANPLRVVGGIFLALIISSSASAQIYSFNAVGYADVDYVAGSNLVANPFHAADNSISNLFRGVPDGTVFLPGQGGADLSFGPTNLFSAASGWTAPAATLVAPRGGFLVLPAPTTVTFVGDVFWPEVVLRSGGTRWEVLDRFPEKWPPVFCASFTDPCPQSAPPDGTQFHQWNRVQQRYDVFIYLSLAPGFEPFAWYDSNLNVVTPRLQAGEAGAFFIPDPDPPRTWVRGGGMRRADVSMSRPQVQGTNLSFQFSSGLSNQFTVLHTTNLSTPRWETVQTGTCTSAVVEVTVPAPSAASGFYRLVPPLGDQTVLMNPSRTGTVFRCEFNAPVTGTYSLLRRAELTASTSTVVWSGVVQSNTVVTATDASATQRVGYYLVRRETP